ncbi:hypothetical protein DID75_03195 [Candidatus Marinamargulisbacteria bacterium SCGC AG-410-N11]|nr:hypothetical protein DID75_03195 [Candidatus Marinamargulisbacteria bacterium SCGC AG-410-N11]
MIILYKKISFPFRNVTDDFVDVEERTFSESPSGELDVDLKSVSELDRYFKNFTKLHEGVVGTDIAQQSYSATYGTTTLSNLIKTLKIFKSLASDDSLENYEFWELGSGLGACVFFMLYAEKFKSVLGVELHPPFCRVAEQLYYKLRLEKDFNFKTSLDQCTLLEEDVVKFINDPNRDHSSHEKRFIYLLDARFLKVHQVGVFNGLRMRGWPFEVLASTLSPLDLCKMKFPVGDLSNNKVSIDGNQTYINPELICHKKLKVRLRGSGGSHMGTNFTLYFYKKNKDNSQSRILDIIKHGYNLQGISSYKLKSDIIRKRKLDQISAVTFDQPIKVRWIIKTSLSGTRAKIKSWEKTALIPKKLHQKLFKSNQIIYQLFDDMDVELKEVIQRMLLFLKYDLKQYSFKKERISYVTRRPLELVDQRLFFIESQDLNGLKNFVYSEPNISQMFSLKNLIQLEYQSYFGKSFDDRIDEFYNLFKKELNFNNFSSSRSEDFLNYFQHRLFRPLSLSVYFSKPCIEEKLKFNKLYYLGYKLLQNSIYRDLKLFQKFYCIQLKQYDESLDQIYNSDIYFKDKYKDEMRSFFELNCSESLLGVHNLALEILYDFSRISDCYLQLEENAFKPFSIKGLNFLQDVANGIYQYKPILIPFKSINGYDELYDNFFIKKHEHSIVFNKEVNLNHKNLEEKFRFMMRAYITLMTDCYNWLDIRNKNTFIYQFLELLKRQHDMAQNRAKNIIYRLRELVAYNKPVDASESTLKMSQLSIRDLLLSLFQPGHDLGFDFKNCNPKFYETEMFKLSFQKKYSPYLNMGDIDQLFQIRFDEQLFTRFVSNLGKGFFKYIFQFNQDIKDTFNMTFQKEHFYFVMLYLLMNQNSINFRVFHILRSDHQKHLADILKMLGYSFYQSEIKESNNFQLLQDHFLIKYHESLPSFLRSSKYLEFSEFNLENLIMEFYKYKNNHYNLIDPADKFKELFFDVYKDIRSKNRSYFRAISNRLKNFIQKNSRYKSKSSKTLNQFTISDYSRVANDVASKKGTIANILYHFGRNMDDLIHYYIGLKDQNIKEAFKLQLYSVKNKQQVIFSFLQSKNSIDIIQKYNIDIYNDYVDSKLVLKNNNEQMKSCYTFYMDKKQKLEPVYKKLDEFLGYWKKASYNNSPIIFTRGNCYFTKNLDVSNLYKDKLSVWSSLLKNDITILEDDISLCESLELGDYKLNVSLYLFIKRMKMFDDNFNQWLNNFVNDNETMLFDIMIELGFWFKNKIRKA